MGLPLVASLAAVVSGLLFRRVPENNADGRPAERLQTRPVPAALGVLLAFLALYHFLLWPILNHHFPEYGFPPLDLAALSASLAAVAGL